MTIAPPIFHPGQNDLIAAFNGKEWSQIADHLELVALPLGEVLYEPGITMRYVYFPISAIISLLYVMEDGYSAEIAVVGK